MGATARLRPLFDPRRPAWPPLAASPRVASPRVASPRVASPPYIFAFPLMSWHSRWPSSLSKQRVSQKRTSPAFGFGTELVLRRLARAQASQAVPSPCPRPSRAVRD